MGCVALTGGKQASGIIAVFMGGRMLDPPNIILSDL